MECEMWCWRKVKAAFWACKRAALGGQSLPFCKLKRLLPARKKAASACQMSCFCMSNELLLHVKRAASARQKEGFEIEKAMGLKDKGSRKRPGCRRSRASKGVFIYLIFK